jgi:hypothetical protein
MTIQSMQIFPGHVEFPAANPAQWAISNARQVLAFDATTNESAILTFPMPQAYASGALTLLLYCLMASATTGDVDVDAAVEAITPDNSESGTSDSFDTANSEDNTAVPGTAGQEFTVAVTLTNDDGVAAGDMVRVRVTRDAASDTATGDLYVRGAEIREA